MTVKAGYLLPHPPIMVPEVGKSEVQKISSTLNAAKRVGEEVKSLIPDTVIIITPHGPVFRDGLAISTSPVLKGDLREFGEPGVQLEFKNDEELVDVLMQEGKGKGIELFPLKEQTARRLGIQSQLDHGAVVPLYFLKGDMPFELVHISIGLLPFKKLYDFGKLIQRVVDKRGKKAVVVASGDLSHRLIPGAPAGYTPEGEKFDNLLVDNLKNYNVEGVLNMDEDLIEKAGECGLRPIIIMLGSLHGLKVTPEILSYEGPFGVGYCVAKFQIQGGNQQNE